MRVVEREPPARRAGPGRATGAPSGDRAPARPGRRRVGLPGARPPARAHPVRGSGRSSWARRWAASSCGARPSACCWGGQANALVVRGEVVEREVVTLAGEGERRVLVLAVVVVRGERWTVGTTHLSLRPAVAREQVGEALHLLITRPGPWVLAGDLNLEPPDVASRRRAARLRPARRAGDPLSPPHPDAPPRPRAHQGLLGHRERGAEAPRQRPPGRLGRPVAAVTAT